MCVSVFVNFCEGVAVCMLGHTECGSVRLCMFGYVLSCEGVTVCVCVRLPGAALHLTPGKSLLAVVWLYSVFAFPPARPLGQVGCCVGIV